MNIVVCMITDGLFLFGCMICFNFIISGIRQKKDASVATWISIFVFYLVKLLPIVLRV